MVMFQPVDPFRGNRGGKKNDRSTGIPRKPPGRIEETKDFPHAAPKGFATPGFETNVTNGVFTIRAPEGGEPFKFSGGQSTREKALKEKLKLEKKGFNVIIATSTDRFGITLWKRKAPRPQTSLTTKKSRNPFRRKRKP